MSYFISSSLATQLKSLDQTTVLDFSDFFALEFTNYQFSKINLTAGQETEISLSSFSVLKSIILFSDGKYDISMNQDGDGNNIYRNFYSSRDLIYIDDQNNVPSQLVIRASLTDPVGIEYLLTGEQA